MKNTLEISNWIQGTTLLAFYSLRRVLGRAPAPRGLAYFAQPQPQPQALFGAELAVRLYESSPLGVCLADRAGRCLYANAAYLEITGLTHEQARGARWSGSLHPDDRERVNAEWLDAVLARQAFQAEVRVRRPDGGVVWARLHGSTAQGEGGTSATLLLVDDITERKAAESVLSRSEDALFAEKERAQVTLDSIGDAVLVTDLAGNVTYLNLEAVNLTGWSREDATGQPLETVFQIVDGATRNAAQNPAERAIAEDSTVGLAIGCVLLRRDGTEVEIEDSAAPIHDRDGAVTGAVIVFHDVARSMLMSERMAHLARHDHLTGLANTALLAERLEQVVRLANRHRKQVALLFIDLDRFKEVNDAHGHEFGDQVLRAVARRLEACVRESDTVCRRGGDEFVILLTEIECRRDAAQVAEKVLAAVAAEHVIDGHAVRVGASIGISVYPGDGDDAGTLLRRADVAMYQVKGGSQAGYCFAGAGRPGRSTPLFTWPGS
jgi:diguanylate cyclase (GGDEF)-like protein/PAS domain S-box-containing protein